MRSLVVFNYPTPFFKLLIVITQKQAAPGRQCSQIPGAGQSREPDRRPHCPPSLDRPHDRGDQDAVPALSRPCLGIRSQPPERLHSEHRSDSGAVQDHPADPAFSGFSGFSGPAPSGGQALDHQGFQIQVAALQYHQGSETDDVFAPDRPTHH